MHPAGGIASLAPPPAPAPVDGVPAPVVPPPTTRRPASDVLSWDAYFMFTAALAARRSKDPSTQVGACIVDGDNRIVGTGYNGFPRGISDDSLPWAREAASPLDTKYPYVIHAEANAILNKNAATLMGARLYVGLFPCNECAKTIIQSGIVEVVYASDKYHDATPFVAARRLFALAGVRTRQFIPDSPTLTLCIDAQATLASPAKPPRSDADR